LIALFLAMAVFLLFFRHAKDSFSSTGHCLLIICQHARRRKRPAELSYFNSLYPLLYVISILLYELIAQLDLIRGELGLLLV